MFSHASVEAMETTARHVTIITCLIHHHLKQKHTDAVEMLFCCVVFQLFIHYWQCNHSCTMRHSSVVCIQSYVLYV